MVSKTSGGDAAPQHAELDDKLTVQQIERSVLGELPAEHIKILRKIDYRVIPILAVLYLLSFLDRGESIKLSD